MKHFIKFRNAFAKAAALLLGAMTAFAIASCKTNVDYYTVTFDTAGGSAAPEAQKIESGKTVTKPTDPTKEGAVFRGWLYGFWFYDFSSPVTSDLELRALWGHTVTFDSDGGNHIEPLTVGNFISISELESPTKDGYYFIGWYLDDSAVDRFTEITSNITLKAKWSHVNEFSETQYTASGDYILFGDFPQTIKADSVTIDETECVLLGNYVGFKGSDGSWYVKQAENAKYTGSDYKYSDGTEVSQGGTTFKYFKIEPIKWKILDNSYDIDGDNGNATGKLLSAQNILIAHCFDSDDSSNYKESDIREYLNGDLLNTAFTSTLQSCIVSTTVNNSVSTTGFEENPNACENTSDKLFLLSYSEIRNSAYFSGEKIYLVPTDFSKATGELFSINDGQNEAGDWWLRSPVATNTFQVRGVDCFGQTWICVQTMKSSVGVVPALCMAN